MNHTTLFSKKKQLNYITGFKVNLLCINQKKKITLHPGFVPSEDKYCEI